MSSYNFRTRRSHRPTTPPMEELDAPMSGAGYDIEEEHRQLELRWAKLDHAVQLALNYFKQRPVPIEHAEYVRAFVLERA